MCEQLEAGLAELGGREAGRGEHWEQVVLPQAPGPSAPDTASVLETGRGGQKEEHSGRWVMFCGERNELFLMGSMRRSRRRHALSCVTEPGERSLPTRLAVLLQVPSLGACWSQTPRLPHSLAALTAVLHFVGIFCATVMGITVIHLTLTLTSGEGTLTTVLIHGETEGWRGELRKAQEVEP